MSATQKVYVFVEDLGDGSCAVHYTKNPDLLKILQDQQPVWFNQNEGYANTLTFPGDVDLEDCGFDFYDESELSSKEEE